MSYAAYNCNDYKRGKFNALNRAALGYKSDHLNVWLEKHRECLNEGRNLGVQDGDMYLVSTSEEGSMGSDGYYSSSERMSYESQCEQKTHYNSTQYSCFDELDDSQSLDLGIVHFDTLPPATSYIEKSWLPTDKMGQPEDYSAKGFSLELNSGDYERDTCPTPAPIWQIPQSPINGPFQDPSIVFAKSTKTRPVTARSFEELNPRNRDEIVNTNFDQFKDGSFLFASADNVEWLKFILTERGLDVHDIWKTGQPGILAVLFRTHESAKQAFTAQKEIGVRMIPHSTTRRYWYKNPSPKFHVIYETTRRLTVKSGKSFSNRSVGDFLMKSARMDRGCIIWADQMKGYRLRVVGFVGKFLRRDGRVIVRTRPPSTEETRVIGWVSTQCKNTKTKFVLRITGKQIEDYLYSNALE